MTSLTATRTGWLYEPLNRRPYDIFFLVNGTTRVVGRQRPEIADGTAPAPRSPLVTASMLLGHAKREQLLANGLLVYYRPLAESERGRVFQELVATPSTDLVYPYPALSRRDGSEWLLSTEDWTPNADKVEEWNRDEAFLREHTVRKLAKYDLHGKTVFDPACSTGEFLADVKRAYPHVRVVGHDLNPRMVAYARERLDDVHCCDAAAPQLPEEAADIVVCRFLNFRVVTTRQAHRLFPVVARRCRIGGYILVAGFTPVLLSAEWFEVLGLSILERTGYSEQFGAVFQYYWLHRRGGIGDFAIPNLACDDGS